MKSHLSLFILIAAFVGPVAAAVSEHVLIEAESFENPGGWVVDQQFMDQMGSPFLLAHGLGVGVQNATTTVTLPQSGHYFVWVRTRDWTAKPEEGKRAPGVLRDAGPGRFQLIIDGTPLRTHFGREGATWHW